MPEIRSGGHSMLAWLCHKCEVAVNLLQMHLQGSSYRCRALSTPCRQLALQHATYQCLLLSTSACKA